MGNQYDDEDDYRPPKWPDWEPVVEEGFNKPEWFDYQMSYMAQKSSPYSEEAMQSFKHCIDDLGTSESIINYLKTALPADPGVYHEGNQPELMEKFAKKYAKKFMEPGEKLLFMGDNGFIFKGKSGFVVTDRRIVFSGKQPIAVAYKDLKKMGFNVGQTYVHIYLNDNGDARIYALRGNSYIPYGAFAALISAFAFEQNPDREKIIICKQVF